MWQQFTLLFLGMAMMVSANIEWGKVGTTKELKCSSEYELTVCNWKSGAMKEFQSKDSNKLMDGIR